MLLKKLIEEGGIVESQTQRNILHLRILRAQLCLGIHDERPVDNLHCRMPRLLLDKSAKGGRLHIHLLGIIRHLVLTGIFLMYHPDKNPVLMEMPAARRLFEFRLFRTKFGYPLQHQT